MAKPIIKTINTFDASKGTTVNFVWTGNAAYNNRLVVYDAEKLTVVYDDTYSTNYYKLAHDIPAYKLVNGKKYAAEIYVIDRNGQVSEPSDKYYFWTNSAAQFYFDGLDTAEENIVENSSLTVLLKYFQVDSVPISSYQFFLYSSSKTLLDSTEVYQNPKSMTHTYRSLENMTKYYIRATGYNARNMALDTGFICLNVRYAEPNAYAQIYADVNTTIGTVDYYTNIVQVASERPSEQYSYEEGWVDLTQTDPNRSIEIAASGNVPPGLAVYYTKTDGSNGYVTGEGIVTVKDFSEIQEIDIVGSYSQPVPQTAYSYLTDCSLIIDGKKISDVLGGNYLRATPSHSDILVITGSGRRAIHRNVGEASIDQSYAESASSTPRRKTGAGYPIIGYSFFLDLAVEVIEYIDVVCDRFLVANPEEDDDYKKYTAFVRLDNEHGSKNLELYLDLNTYGGSSSGIWGRTIDIDAFLSGHSFRVMYPLTNSTVEYLSNIEVPSFKNVNNVRYSKGFTVPFENATYSVRMRKAFREGEVLRAHNGDNISFILESKIYEDGYLKYKLTADSFVYYSEPMTFRDWDIVTVHVRRMNGLYGLYVFIQEEEQDALRNMWFISTEPEDGTESDIWFDKDYPTTYIDKDTVVRYYQSTEPSGASDQNIWIGDI